MLWFSIALLSSFLSAFAAITQKKVLIKRNPLEFSFLLSVANLLFSVPFFFFIDYGTINSVNMIILFIKSVLGVGAFLCVMTALKNLEISRALPLLALTPGFVAFFAFFLLGESLAISEIAGLVLLTAGTYILESKNLKDFSTPLSLFLTSKVHKIILLALLLFTASSILDKVLMIKLNLTPVALTGIQHLWFALLFGAVFLLKSNSNGINFSKPILYDAGWISLISILTIGYRFTQVFAVNMASVALVLSVKRTSVLWATLIGGKIFKETQLLKRLIAVCIILAGLLLILRE